MRIIYLLFTILCLCSCRHTMPDKMWTDETTAKDTTATVPEAVVSNPQAFAAAVNSLIAARENAKQQLTTLSPQQADSLYDIYMPKCYEKIAQMERFEETFINDYYRYVTYNDKGEVTKVNDSIQKKINLLDKAGLEIWDIGEGLVEIRPKPEYFLVLFGSYVSTDYKEFIALQAEDDKVLFDNDAAIAIPCEDVGKRVINWENFISTYPESRLKKDAATHYRYYQYAFLVGADNTPVLEYGSNEMYPEIHKAFENFIAKYPESPTSALVKMVLAFKGDEEGLAILITEQQKLQQPQK